MTLLKLNKIELRQEWKNEASDFTNWLAKEESLQLLSDEIGIDISLIQTEASVGKFNVDMLAEEESTGRKIVIENQLEVTNHDHLGKIITYASGFDAEIIIWIVKDVRDEHRQAVDWLNEHTDDEINIFAIRMELWQIGDSAYAPKFHIISKPNDWSKAVKKSRARLELSDAQMTRLEFWEQFKEFSNLHKSTLRVGKVYPRQWLSISIGTSKAHLDFGISSNHTQIGCELYIPNSKLTFETLYKNKDSIETELNLNLEWRKLEEKKASSIRIMLNLDVNNHDCWKNGFQWLIDTGYKFRDVFYKQIKMIKRL